MKNAHTIATEQLVLLDARADEPGCELLLSVKLGADGAPPTEFQLLAAGETRTTKGTILCDDAHAALCLAAETMPSDGLLPLDYDHDMVSFIGTNKKAAGWFKLANRNGSLWATEVTYTPAADKALRDREYRYFSPALFRDEEGYVTRMVNCALCCLPATIKQKPLVASQSPGESDNMDLAQLLAAFGVQNATQLAASFNQTRTDLAKAQSDNAALIVAAQAQQGQIATLTAAVEARKTADAVAEKAALITQLSSEGKLPPALHEWAKGQSVEQLRTYGAHAPVIAAASTVVVPKASDPSAASVELGASELAICAQMKIAPKDFIAQKALLATAGDGPLNLNVAAPGVSKKVEAA